MKLELIYNFFRTKHGKNVLITLIAGIISVFLGELKFYIPGVEGAQSDFRELPLLIGTIHVSNPFYTIILSAITVISNPGDGSEISTFIMHAVSLFVIWYFFSYLLKKSFTRIKSFIAGILVTILYYQFLILPSFVLTNIFLGLNSDKNFIELYIEMTKILRFELFSTAVAVSFYFVQFILRIEIENHKNNLERVVDEKTNHLKSTIEELKTTQNYLIQSEKMASLGTLTKGVAHEINNPLNFINGGICIVDDYTPEIEKNISPQTFDEFAKAVGFIKEGVERISKIVNALSTFSGKSGTQLMLRDINFLADNTIMLNASDIPSEIEIIKKYNLKQNVPVYSEKFHQIIQNILSNSVYELKNISEKQKQIIIETYQSENKAFIKISNNGKQISAENLHCIFDPFFTTKSPHDGNGLGLSVVYTLVEEHNGNISAENTDFGVCFTIELPL
jgi:signal transduction histidine kinase